MRVSGMCSNALAFANASANATFAFAFALAFDSIQSNAKQMRIKCHCITIMFILLVCFVWNKPQEDQYKKPFDGSVSKSQCTHRQKQLAMCEWHSCLDCQRR